jgi:hypothetical protein
LAALIRGESSAPITFKASRAAAYRRIHHNSTQRQQATTAFNNSKQHQQATTALDNRKQH